MKTSTTLLLVAFATTTLTPVVALAQDKGNGAYWVNSTGIIWKNPYGLCWRAGYWTPAQAIAECDPDLVKKPEAPLPPVAAAAPQPVAPAPAPAPAPTPAPQPRIVAQKVSFSAEELFDFDKYVLKAEGKTALDKLADDLSGASYDVVIVTGHTDRIGSAAYNQKLSERRAGAVKGYLISKGVAPERISSSGKGKTQPVTKAGECKGSLNQKLIACLQPDRRVEVEVTGTKQVTVSQ